MVLCYVCAEAVKVDLGCRQLVVLCNRVVGKDPVSVFNSFYRVDDPYE